MAQVVKLVDLLDEAKARCKATIQERRADFTEEVRIGFGSDADEFFIKERLSPVSLDSQITYRFRVVFL